MAGETRIKLSEFAPIIDSAEFQKSYLFRIALPKNIEIEQEKKTISALDPIQYCVSATAFPTSSTASQPVAYFNSELKFAAKTSYNNWQVTFRTDIKNSNFVVATSLPSLGSSFSLGGIFGAAVPIAATVIQGSITCYEYFNYWRQSVYWEKDRISSLPSKYKQDIVLWLLDENGDEKTRFILEGAWPTTIQGGTLEYGSDSILTFSVEFAFDRYVYGNA